MFFLILLPVYGRSERADGISSGVLESCELNKVDNNPRIVAVLIGRLKSFDPF